MNNPLVSVVIPVFNGEKWVQRCVSSVLSQTYANIEVIIVDDGSKDGSGEICDSMASRDCRIKVIHQENGGVNSARRNGVGQISGDWLLFLDADDTLPSDAIETYSAFFQSSAEILVHGDEDGPLSTDEYLQMLLKGTVEPGVVLKAFDAAFYKKHSPQLGRELAMGEDLLINLVVGMNASSVRSVKGDLYEINTQNSDSVTKVFKKTWEYEKHYFNVLEDLFLCKCKGMDCYDKLELLVRKSQLNGIKYVMLTGNKIDYSDDAFCNLERYFKGRKDDLGPSEKMIFKVKNPCLYRSILKTYMALRRGRQ